MLKIENNFQLTPLIDLNTDIFYTFTDILVGTSFIYTPLKFIAKENMLRADVSF